MLEQISQFIQMVFTHYLVGLMLVCGVVLSFIYPAVAGNSKFPTEYKLGRYIGFFYIGLALAMFVFTLMVN